MSAVNEPIEETARPHPAPGEEVSWIFGGDTSQRLTFLTETMRHISRQGDAQQLVADYYVRMQQAFPTQGYLSLSRRNLPPPHYRVTRSDQWGIDFNPWTSSHTKPVYTGGLLGELIYRGEPVILDDLQQHVREDDPARWAFEGLGSLMAIPMFDDGEALNMVVFLRRDKGAFDHGTLPEHVWVTNLFGRATNNLLLRQQMLESNARLRRELDAVGEIQRSLLPEVLPQMPEIKLAAHYHTSEQAGGDYYDFFHLPEGRIGIFIADVSGHGTAAAVIMAVTHAIAHAIENPPHPDPPHRMLRFLNAHLCERYTRKGGTFVTAFYGIYDPKTRQLTYANAGHPPPRVKHDNGRPDARAGQADILLDQLRNLPLGIDPEEDYTDARHTLEAGDVLVLYTDGITEARSPDRGMWGTQGLDNVLTHCSCDPPQLVEQVIAAVNAYTGNAPPDDDRTLVVAKVR